MGEKSATTVTSLGGLESQVRDLINERRRQHALIQRDADWNIVCSALDVIGDTELALDAYLAIDGDLEDGMAYLLIYGALQVLQTQQVAVEELCDALGTKPTQSPKIPAIRQVRSAAVGHPTSEKESGVVRSAFIQRMTVSPFGFNLMTVYSGDRPYSIRFIQIPSLIEQQRTVLKGVLEELRDTLMEADMSHREKHKQNPLSGAFPPTLGYHVSKILEATHNPTLHPLGKANVEMVRGFLQKFKALVEDRDEWDPNEGVRYEYNLLTYPLNQLDAYFSGSGSAKLNAEDAHIFATFVKVQIDQVVTIAKDLDADYAGGKQ